VTGMKKITLWLMSTLTVVVLLFGYHTSTSSANAQGGNSSLASPAQSGTVSGSATGSGSASTSGSGGTGSSGGTAAASSSAAAASPSASSGTSGTSGTYTGSQADTRWGLVQVQITVVNGKITKVSVPVYPDNNGRDQEINARALPILIQETLHAQSAQIDMVSGGTVTSGGYVESLQSALDKAGL
jgi:uncharacterized protein with FMN-binding domain